MSDGLSQVSVMFKGRYREGVSIYDGERMRVYKGWENLDPESSINVLLGHECDHLTGNRQGDIFFRTCDSLVRYDIRKRNFVLLVVVRRKRLPRSMVIYGRGTMIWFAGMMKKGDSLQLYAKTNTLVYPAC